MSHLLISKDPTSYDLLTFRKLNREKSFDEARTAVQSQIEKIFLKAASGPDSDPTPIHRSSSHIFGTTSEIV
jgi:hypothetical protein